MMNAAGNPVTDEQQIGLQFYPEKGGNTKRLVVISDTHGLDDRIEGLRDGEILVHAGDFMNSWYDIQEILSFNRWFSEQRFKHRVVSGGNPDRYFEAAPQQARALLINAVYLENIGIMIDGLTFWGSTYTPEFLNWAFMYPRGTSAQRYWNLIPDNLNVLITHGPPFGILDQSAPGEVPLDAKNCSIRSS
jgi:Calcineurin-like phosphoesterase